MANRLLGDLLYPEHSVTVSCVQRLGKINGVDSVENSQRNEEIVDRVYASLG